MIWSKPRDYSRATTSPELSEARIREIVDAHIVAREAVVMAQTQSPVHMQPQPQPLVSQAHMQFAADPSTSIGARIVQYLLPIFPGMYMLAPIISALNARNIVVFAGLAFCIAQLQMGQMIGDAIPTVKPVIQAMVLYKCPITTLATALTTTAVSVSQNPTPAPALGNTSQQPLPLASSPATASSAALQTQPIAPPVIEPATLPLDATIVAPQAQVVQPVQ